MSTHIFTNRSKMPLKKPHKSRVRVKKVRKVVVKKKAVTVAPPATVVKKPSDKAVTVAPPAPVVKKLNDMQWSLSEGTFINNAATAPVELVIVMDDIESNVEVVVDDVKDEVKVYTKADLNMMSKKELCNKADELGVAYNPKDKKAVIIKAILKSIA